MKALGFREHGGIDDLEILDLPEPTPGEGEALVEVEAGALNHLDLFVLRGWPGLDLEMPHVGGSDLCGVVEEMGPGVEDADVAPGDRVVLYPSRSCGTCRFCRRGEVSLCREHHLIGEHEGGSFRERMAVPVENLVKVPEGTDLEPPQLAAAPLAFLTAWRMLVTRGELTAGEDVLVVGAGGGVNSAAVQIADLAGAHVTVVAGGEEKAKRIRELGADETVDYTADDDWHRTLYKARGKRGFDLVVDNVGEATWTKSLRAVDRGGRIVVVGGTTGYDPSAHLNHVFWKQIDIRGSTMGTPDEMATVMDRVFRGELDPVVDRVVDLDDGVEAYRALDEGSQFGKIVIVP